MEEVLLSGQKNAIFIKMHVKERNATSGTIVITIMPTHIY